MTTNDIDAIRKLADAATDAPWTGANYRSALAGLATGTGNHAADAEFIRAARTLVPALCDEIEQLRTVVEAAQLWSSVRSDRGSDGMEFHRACVALSNAVDRRAAERARTQETHQ